MKEAIHETVNDYLLPGREYELVSLDRIFPDPLNVRQHYKLSKIRSIGSSMSDKGQLQSGIAELRDNGFDLVFGHQRYWSLRENEKRSGYQEQMRLAITQPLPALLRLKIQMHENHFKARLPFYEVADELWNRYLLYVEDVAAKSELKDMTLSIVQNATDWWQLPKELRKLAPIMHFAEFTNKDPATIRRAFAYQRLHTDIKRRVRERKIPYESATRLATVGLMDPSTGNEVRLNKNDQVIVLKQAEMDAKRNGKGLKPVYIGRMITGYIEDKIAICYDNFMKCPESSKPWNTTRYRNYSKFLKTAGKYLAVLRTIGEFDEELWDSSINYQKQSITPRSLILETYKRLKVDHEIFLQNEVYARRWEPKSKLTMEEKIENISLSDSSQKERKQRVMNLASFAWIHPDKIKFHPKNPRGNPKNFNEEAQEGLEDSIADIGMLEEILLMEEHPRQQENESWDGDYISLEGNRRTKVAKKRNEPVRTAILPYIPEKAQMEIMFDADNFENPDHHDLFVGIGRDFELSKKEYHHNGDKYNLRLFIEENPHFSPQLIRNAVRYFSVPERVQRLFQEGTIPFGVVSQVSNLDDEESQVQMAETAAILSMKSNRVQSLIKTQKNKNADVDTSGMTSKQQKYVNNHSNGMLWDDDADADLDGQFRTFQQKKLIGELQLAMMGTYTVLEAFSPIEKKALLSDYGKTKAFQNFFRSLEDVIDQINC